MDNLSDNDIGSKRLRFRRLAKLLCPWSLAKPNYVVRDIRRWISHRLLDALSSARGSLGRYSPCRDHLMASRHTRDPFPSY